MLTTHRHCRQWWQWWRRRNVKLWANWIISLNQLASRFFRFVRSFTHSICLTFSHQLWHDLAPHYCIHGAPHERAEFKKTFSQFDAFSRVNEANFVCCGCCVVVDVEVIRDAGSLSPHSLRREWNSNCICAWKRLAFSLNFNWIFSHCVRLTPFRIDANVGLGSVHGAETKCDFTFEWEQCKQLTAHQVHGWDKGVDLSVCWPSVWVNSAMGSRCWGRLIKLSHIALCGDMCVASRVRYENQMMDIGVCWQQLSGSEWRLCGCGEVSVSCHCHWHSHCHWRWKWISIKEDCRRQCWTIFHLDVHHLFSVSCPDGSTAFGLLD